MRACCWVQSQRADNRPSRFVRTGEACAGTAVLGGPGRVDDGRDGVRAGGDEKRFSTLGAVRKAVGCASKNLPNGRAYAPQRVRAGRGLPQRWSKKRSQQEAAALSYRLASSHQHAAAAVVEEEEIHCSGLQLHCGLGVR